MDLRERQRRSRTATASEPDDARITLSARGSETGDAGRLLGRRSAGSIQEAQAHAGVGGPGHRGLLRRPAARSARRLRPDHLPDGRRGDWGSRPSGSRSIAEGELDLRGTLGVDPRAPVGFECDPAAARGRCARAPAPSELESAARASTERYCTVLQTLRDAAADRDGADRRLSGLRPARRGALPRRGRRSRRSTARPSAVPGIAKSTVSMPVWPIESPVTIWAIAPVIIAPIDGADEARRRSRPRSGREGRR